jgi:peptidoglycan/xylan/chitin deacetylase (PgdA/CDA1 family)
MAATGVLRISDEARGYGLRELCRRAGLRDEDERQWRVEQVSDGLVLRRVHGAGRIVFPRATGELKSELTVRKGWLREGNNPLSAGVPDFVVPFCSAESKAGEPLFVVSAPGEFRCTEDLPASAVLVLSRYEEIAATRKDEHGRFRSADSIAARDGYLDRPIVDEWGLALEQAIAALEPGFRAERHLRVKVSHDVDLIGIPFRLREPAVQMIKRRNPGVALRDLLSGFTGVAPGSLGQVIEICEQVQARGLRPALYWKASARTAHDSGYNIADPRVARVMDWAAAHGAEMGAHPGYDTFANPEELTAEVERIRKAIGEREIGGRQHYLRWSPETWRHWEQCGLAYDSTLGYADRAGFRAGTCWPYRPWLWNENRRAELLEIPLVVMDQTLISPVYMGLSPDESVAIVRDLLRKCANVGGVFTLLWHNNCLGRPYAAYWPRIFDALAGLENYNWREDLRRDEVTRRT